MGRVVHKGKIPLNNKSVSLIKNIQDYVSYCQKKGKFFWIKKTTNKTIIGSEVGFLEKQGYRVITFNGVRFKAHKLVWFFEYNFIPTTIDHINGNRDDNRIENLRISDSRKNLQNKKCHREGKLVGASYRKKWGNWVSQIRINKKNVHLGYFKTELEAHNAYISALSNLKKLNKAGK